MSSQHEVISLAIPLRLVVKHGEPLPLVADLTYDVADPFAVRIGFRADGEDEPSGTEDWTFARQLLSDGIAERTGQGDVEVWPAQTDAGPLVCLALSSPTGRAVFEVPLGGLVEFLSATYAVVPTGCESDMFDMDAEITLLLGSDAA